MRRDEARLEIGRGGDPARRRREDKIKATIGAGDTFEAVANEYVRKCEAEGFATATLVKANCFIKLFSREIGSRPIAEITPHEMLAALRKIERGGRRESARRARSFASRVFRYAVATLRAENDPCAPLKGALVAPVPRHYAALTNPEELGRLLRCIDRYDGNHTRQSVGGGRKVHVAGLRREHWETPDPVRTIFKAAFSAAGLPYFSPHSFRNCIMNLGERVCRTPEQKKAYSQNLGHEDVRTSLTSYGAVSLSRQSEILSELAIGEGSQEQAAEIGRMLLGNPALTALFRESAREV